MDNQTRKTAQNFLTGSDFAILPIILSIVLYLLLFFIRFQQVCPVSVDVEGDCRQGDWEESLDLFPQIRQSLDQQISQFLPSPQAELLSGIILGNEQSSRAKHTRKDFIELKLAMRDTSTIHMMVVSGQNLTLLASFLLSFAGLIRKKNAILLSLLLIVFYTMLTGAQIPVLRAAIMVVLASLAAFFGRQSDGLRILAITAGSMLLVNPVWIFEISFQLSFLATLGILVLAPVLENSLSSRLPLFLRKDLGVTIGAQLMVMPVILQNFHQLSLVSVFANLLVGWSIPFIMILGLVFLIVSFLSNFLGQVAAFVLSILLTYFIYIVQFFASLPFAWEYVGEQVWIVWVGYYMVMGGILIALHKFEARNSKS